ncbi:UNVERIFIED_CONTAM: hypothetical protein Sangu_2026500 [Sesamum angustifolium]|uniref:BRO1 domain-containing protein n=1 Tax=Sesamum angustifolium TaxID=2727405 RepID=A0AAW2LIW8_9LAMI
MGCLVSTPKDTGGNRRRPANIGDVSVFVPGLRIPKPVDFSQSLGDHLAKSLVERLSALRTRIVVMAGQEAPTITRTRRKSATQHGGSTLGDLLQALEDYLPVLLGLVKDGSPLQHKVQFVWVNQEDEAEAAGYLDCAVRHVLPQLPNELRRNLPVDLAEGVLRALCLQALGQGVDIQLGLAIDSTKATLAVKRRLACEMVKYWQQAQDNIMNLPLANGWGEKHRLFVKWKYIEAKAAAYYYHGLILDEGNTEKSHGMAVAALQAADEYLKESKKACEAFHASIPVSRIMETAPTLPDFALALKPDEYQLPLVDASWNEEATKKGHLSSNKSRG